MFLHTPDLPIPASTPRIRFLSGPPLADPLSAFRTGPRYVQLVLQSTYNETESGERFGDCLNTVRWKRWEAGGGRRGRRGQRSSAGANACALSKEEQLGWRRQKT